MRARTIQIPREAMVAGGILIALVTLAALAPVISPFAFDALDLAHRRAAPSTSHWFGTDELGRDLLTRVLFGARVSLAVGFVSAAVSVLLGVAIGATAGWHGRWIDAVLMRVTDAMLAVPRLPLLMIAAAVLAPNVALLVFLVGAAGWMETARVVRAEVQSIKANDFVTAARAVGAASPRVVEVARNPIPLDAPVIRHPDFCRERLAHTQVAARTVAAAIVCFHLEDAAVAIQNPTKLACGADDVEVLALHLRLHHPNQRCRGGRGMLMMVSPQT